MMAPSISRSCAVSRRMRSEEHTSELQSQSNLVCRLLLEKKNCAHQCTAGSHQPPAKTLSPHMFHSTSSTAMAAMTYFFSASHLPSASLTNTLHALYCLTS